VVGGRSLAVVTTLVCSVDGFEKQRI